MIVSDFYLIENWYGEGVIAILKWIKIMAITITIAIRIILINMCGKKEKAWKSEIETKNQARENEHERRREKIQQ